MNIAEITAQLEELDPGQLKDTKHARIFEGTVALLIAHTLLVLARLAVNAPQREPEDLTAALAPQAHAVAKGVIAQPPAVAIEQPPEPQPSQAPPLAQPMQPQGFGGIPPVPPPTVQPTLAPAYQFQQPQAVPPSLQGQFQAQAAQPDALIPLHVAAAQLGMTEEQLTLACHNGVFQAFANQNQAACILQSAIQNYLQGVRVYQQQFQGGIPGADKFS